MVFTYSPWPDEFPLNVPVFPNIAKVPTNWPLWFVVGWPEDGRVDGHMGENRFYENS